MAVKIQRWDKPGQHVAYIPPYKSLPEKWVYATTKGELDRKLNLILGTKRLTKKK